MRIIQPSYTAIAISLTLSLAFALSFAESARAQTGSANSKKPVSGDSANTDSVTKSWTSSDPPQTFDKGFLNSLEWQDHKVGGYTLRTGKIYGKWIAAMQFLQNGKLVLTEYTPPSEYVTVVNPKTARDESEPVAVDANNDGILEIVFLHRKLNDPRYHMYTVYALNKDAPTLIWKSGGKLGDWLHEANKPGRTGPLLKLNTEQRVPK